MNRYSRGRSDAEMDAEPCRGPRRPSAKDSVTAHVALARRRYEAFWHFALFVQRQKSLFNERLLKGGASRAR